MNILIIEDEKFAQEKLQSLIARHCPTGRVIGAIGSIQDAVAFLKMATPPDLIFMDVELSDGLCFEIFKRVQVESKVIITTAYDQYAINAFKVGSIDYLLKPIDTEEFQKAIQRAQQSTIKDSSYHVKYDNLLNALQKTTSKERFTVRIGDRIMVIETANIAYFFAEEKFTYLVTTDAHKYITDLTLDGIADMVDARQFFRLSRGCIARIEAIKSVSKYLNGRLKVELAPKNMINEAPLVSRQRVHDFMQWLEGEI